jgi:pyrroline-5-carboxylate reductase
VKHIVFIGGGNMGEALIAGLLSSKKWKPSEITVTDKRPEALVQLKRKYRVQVASDNKKAVSRATVVLLAVKPQQMRPVLDEIGPGLRSRQLVLSIAAGISCALIEKGLAPHVPVVRVMPNTPALVGAGAAAIAPGRSAKAAHLKTAEQILSTVGLVVRVKESAMDAVTAISGSGPAYVFYVAEAMKETALALGLEPDTADQLVRQTILGAGRLLSSSAEEPQELRRRVTSPNGTTEAALQVMEQGQLKSLFARALKRAAERSKELSQEASKA